MFLESESEPHTFCRSKLFRWQFTPLHRLWRKLTKAMELFLKQLGQKRIGPKLSCSKFELKYRNAFITGISCSTPTIQRHEVDILEVIQV